MQVMILAGGLGTRISEESHLKPKPMIEIGDKPILWHIMKNYSYYGFNKFVICCGYKGNMIRDWFKNYRLYNDECITCYTGKGLASPMYEVNISYEENWEVKLIDTGLDSFTGDRIRIASKYITEDRFMMTYGDGVGDINIKELLDEHNRGSKLVTMTTATPHGRFGIVKVDDSNNVTSFLEKKDNLNALVNAGYFVIDKPALGYIYNKVMWEQQPLNLLVEQKQLHTYHHKGFWQAMDTIRDRQLLEELWKESNAPWRIWE